MLKKFTLLALLSASVTLAAMPNVSAETLSGALAKAYSNNQDLNAARAQLRATDETVPQAKAGLRPRVAGVGTLGATISKTTFGDNLPRSRNTTYSWSTGIQINQTIFDGFQTPNNVRSAKAQVQASQFNLSNTEQNTLLDAVTAYMNVIRDRQIADLRRQNLGFLNEQVRAARARFDVGEGTIFTYAPAVYVPSGRPLSGPLIAHERVHICQHGDDPVAWWARYLSDADFRLKQEVKAHRARGRQLERKPGLGRKRVGIRRPKPSSSW